MAQSTANKQLLQGAQAAATTWFSLHTGDPGTTGANEGSGTGYARGQTVWGSFNSGTGQTPGSQATIGAAAQPYTHWGMWTTGPAAGGTFHQGGALPNGGETYAAPGQYLLTPTLT